MNLELGGKTMMKLKYAAEEAGGEMVMELYQVLLAHYRFNRSWPDGEWPVTGRFDPPLLEVVIGSLLTQNTRWDSVERALEAMFRIGMTSADLISGSPVQEIENAVRSSGFFRQKASSLINVCGLWKSTRGLPPLDITRKELLEVPRIGPETADTLLLYVLDRPAFIADAYSRRLVVRLGFFKRNPGYQSVKDFFEQSLPGEISLFRKFHALIVQHSQQYCRRVPVCGGCPLNNAGFCRL